VTGTGRARGEPDLATLNVGVNIADESISEAVEESNRTIAEITAAIQEHGVEPADIQTTNFGIWAEEQWDPETGQRLPDRLYRVDSTVQINVREVDRVGEILEASIQAGANNIYGLTFGLQDSSDLVAKAREAAIADAEAKAASIAEALGLELGQVVTVVDITGDFVSPVFESAAMGVGGGAGEPPISEGAMSVSASVQISFEIVR
ncbi:MAG: SIMPL domain-containing protein, partial [Anaerolineales bacterium]